MKKIIALIITIVMLIPISTFADDGIKVIMDGKYLSFDQEPVMMNDRVLVPLRAIFEALTHRCYGRRVQAA